jgi:uncharacterized protein YecT (DUF1311 family)
MMRTLRNLPCILLVAAAVGACTATVAAQPATDTQHSAALADIVARLEATYAGNDAGPPFHEAQRRWQAEVDQTCGATVSAVYRGGSIADEKAAECRRLMEQQRAELLASVFRSSLRN